MRRSPETRGSGRTAPRRSGPRGSCHSRVRTYHSLGRDTDAENQRPEPQAERGLDHDIESRASAERTKDVAYDARLGVARACNRDRRRCEPEEYDRDRDEKERPAFIEGLRKNEVRLHAGAIEQRLMAEWNRI